MSARPVFHKELGEFLKTARKAQRLKLRQTATLAQHRYPKLTKGAIEGIEKGETRHIAPEIFQGMAALYKISYADIVARYMASEYGLQVAARDLIRHTGTPASTPQQKGGVDDSSAREIADLKHQLAEYEQFFIQASNAAGVLASAVADLDIARRSSTHGQGGATGGGQRSGHRPHRKTG